MTTCKLRNLGNLAVFSLECIYQLQQLNSEIKKCLEQIKNFN